MAKFWDGTQKVPSYNKLADLLNLADYLDKWIIRIIHVLLLEQARDTAALQNSVSEEIPNVFYSMCDA